MYEYHRAVLRQHDVRPSRQLRAPKAVSEPPRMEALANKDLQLGI